MSTKIFFFTNRDRLLTTLQVGRRRLRSIFEVGSNFLNGNASQPWAQLSDTEIYLIDDTIALQTLNNLWQSLSEGGSQVYAIYHTRTSEDAKNFVQQNAFCQDEGSHERGLARGYYQKLKEIIEDMDNYENLFNELIDMFELEKILRNLHKQWSETDFTNQAGIQNLAENRDTTLNPLLR